MGGYKCICITDSLFKLGPPGDARMGDLEAGGVGRNWVGSERKGQSFGKVKEATVPTW